MTSQPCLALDACFFILYLQWSYKDKTIIMPFLGTGGTASICMNNWMQMQKFFRSHKHSDVYERGTNWLPKMDKLMSKRIRTTLRQREIVLIKELEASGIKVYKPTIKWFLHHQCPEGRIPSSKIKQSQNEICRIVLKCLAIVFSSTNSKNIGF